MAAILLSIETLLDNGIPSTKREIKVMNFGLKTVAKGLLVIKISCKYRENSNKDGTVSTVCYIVKQAVEGRGTRD